jgi:hypothetical protein
MSRANLDYLLPMFELTDSLVDDEERAIGLGQPAEGSRLAGDDLDMAGYYVSYIAIGAIGAALDHAITLKTVARSGLITNSAPWTLLRGILEPASAAAWILIGKTRNIRRERVLRVWHHDMGERQKWEDDTGYEVPAGGKPSRSRTTDIVTLANTFQLRPAQVTTRLSYSDTVEAAGAAAGWSRSEARALWRECSGFAHGRFWPYGHRSSVRHAFPISGGHSLGFEFAEEHHEKVANLALAILKRVMSEYADASAGQEQSPHS